MTSSLQGEQQPVFERLAGALIEATPESWLEATLELTPKQHGSIVSLAHSIYSNEGRREIVEPTEELYSATHNLQLVSERYGDHWSSCIFRVFQEGQAWRFSVTFQR